MGIVSLPVFEKWYNTLPARTKGYRLPSLLITKLVQKDVPYAKRGAEMDKISAEVVYEALREFVMAGGGLEKTLRPWEINTSLMEGVDRSQPWWGWEFETGWKSSEGRSEAIAHCWNTFDGVTFDNEGEGNYQTEVSFIPEPVSDYADGSSQALRFMEWVDANKHNAHNTGYANVGTHLNMSSPLMKNSEDVSDAMRWINRALYWTGHKTGDREYLFGRERLYGVAYPQDSRGTAGWVELKVFRTTYSLSVFKHYLVVAAAIQKLTDYFLSLPANERQYLLFNNQAVSNLREMVEGGADMILRPMSELTYESHDAFPTHTRYSADF